MDGDLTGEQETIMEVVSARAPVSTREIAETLGCSRRAAEHRLRELYADGRLESESIGRELLWWPARDWPSESDRNG